MLPLVQDMWTLAVLCAPVFLVLGAFLGRPSTVGAALPFLFGVMGTLVMHDSAQADLTSFVNGTLAQLAGVFVASRVTRLMRSVGADWSARRIQRATWREASTTWPACRDPPAARRPTCCACWTASALLAPRVAQAGGSVPSVPTDDALHDLRVGADLVALQGARGQLPGEVTLPLQPLLTAIGDWQRAASPATPTRSHRHPPFCWIDWTRRSRVSSRSIPRPGRCRPKRFRPPARWTGPASQPAPAGAGAATAHRRDRFPRGAGSIRRGRTLPTMETDRRERTHRNDDTTASSGSSDLNKENPA